MITSAFRHERVGTLDDALQSVAGQAVPYAGGTELLAAMAMGMTAPDHLVDLKRVAELRGVTAAPKAVRIAAATPHAVVAADPTVGARLPMLAQVTAEVGNPRVRWQGTVGGNVCFAEPRSDLIPALNALQARLWLRSIRNERSTTVAEFIQGPFTVDLRAGELLVGIDVDTDDVIYQRYDRVRLLERPTAGVALVGRRSGWRLCVGAAGYLPTVHDIADPADLVPGDVARAVEPIEDSAGAADYKRHLVEVLVSRVLAAATAAREGRG